jgi:D-amino-acid dehydrogenase
VAQKQVAVIGGGVVGVCTAYFLAKAGHEVVVIERRGNVAEETSFGNAGVMAPGYITPWAKPGMPKNLLAYLFRAESPVLLNRSVSPSLWRWVRLWLAECELSRFRTNMERMQRLALYSRDVLQQLRQHVPMEHEQSDGYLQLFRSEQDVLLAEPVRAMLAELDMVHHVIDADAARLIEPALSPSTALAGGLYYPHAETANCPQFTKQMKHLAITMGVQFHFGSNVSMIKQEGARLALQIGPESFSADAVVLAAGIESAHLLKPLGIRLPLYPVKGYSATAVIRDLDTAPRGALMDEAYKVAIARMGNRIRIAGIAELGSRNGTINAAAQRTLSMVGNDWFPGATNYHSATFWSGTQAVLPDGPPILGVTPIKNLFVNIGHGANGLSMALGSAKVLSDVISERTADINLDGLTLARFQK